MARDIYAVPATGGGVEREFIVFGGVITMHRNRLNPATIRDFMQYKRWVNRHGIKLDIPNEESTTTKVNGDESERELEEENDSEANISLKLWLKNWVMKREIVIESVTQRWLNRSTRVDRNETNRK